MQDEMQLHLDLLEAALRRQGLPPAEAHRRAPRVDPVLALRYE